VYLPAALIFISEIRLLVRRLAKIEADKVQRVRQAPVLATEPALPAVAASEQEAITSKPQVVRRRRRVLNGLNVFAAAVIGLLLVAPTVALPSGAATLTGNSISAGTAQPTGQVLIVRVDFPGAPADQVSWQPITYLFNPVRGVTVDMEGWTLESSRGQVFGFRGATPIYPRQRLDVHSGPSGELLVPGDYLALKDASGHIVDAISWGTDSSQLNPAIQGVATGHHVKRTDGAIDTNSVADWVVKQTE